MIQDLAYLHRLEKHNAKQHEIVVFVKAVVDSHQVSASHELDRERTLLSINRSDLFAIEMALRLAEKTSASVVICSMGVLPSQDMLAKLYALGVDDIDLISDSALKGADTFATAKILAAYLRIRRPQSCILLFGAESSDSATAQVGPQVSVQMNCPLVGDVVSIDAFTGKTLTLHTSGDVFDSLVDAPLPIVLIASTQSTPLRVATIKGVLSSRSRKCNIISAEDLGFKGGGVGSGLSKTSVVRVRPTREKCRAPVKIKTDGVRFLIDQINIAKHALDPSLAIQEERLLSKANNRYLLISDFCGGDGVFECRKIAAHLHAMGGRELALYAIGANDESALFATGIPTLYKCSEKCEGFCDAVSCGHCLADFIKSKNPEVVFFRASSQMRRIAPVVAALLESGLAADCTSFTLSPEVCFERPTFGESRLASIQCSCSAFQMATLRGGRFSGNALVCENPVYTALSRNCHYDSGLRTHIIKRHDSLLWNGDVVLVAGAGIKRESFDSLRWIAQTLKVDFGVTRPLVDKGWIAHRYQVGQTGTTISHPLYISFGVSGEIEHRVAIGDTTKVCAVNTDPNSPIVASCDFFIEADANEIISTLKQTISKGEQNDK